MCTALTMKSKDGLHFFGRNMDIEYSFNQAPHLIPRNFKYINVIDNKEYQTKYAILGMGMSMDNHPMLAEGFNEKGLGCSGLNFPGYAHYEQEAVEGKINMGSFDFMFYILANFETVEELKAVVNDINLIHRSFKEPLQVVPLHWIVTDVNGECIVIEKTIEGMKVYDNKIGVLTNSPTFDYQITNLNQYLGLSSKNPANTSWDKLDLKPLGQGVGMLGIPGDYSPSSRFVKTAFTKAQITQNDDEISTVNAFFHTLDTVAMVSGSVVTPDNKDDITLYSSCMCQETGIYYYKTYYNNQINAIDMNKENLDATEMKVFKYHNDQAINYQN